MSTPALNNNVGPRPSLKEHGAHHPHGMERDLGESKSDLEEKQDYESAVLKLHSLVSNAEVLASVRATSREHRQMTHVQNINKFILRSGITEEEIDKMSLIHVSGTKGKGSTCAFCERILHSKGYKTGLFTSPHLVEVRERVRINGRPISKEVYARHFWKVYNRLIATQEDKDEKLPAYFAFNMILSLHIFLAERVDVAIIEVGIGGQYDSTNFIRNPVVCGVTSLGYDHVSILGNTIEQIAWNKAGIFKTGCPAIVVNQPLPALDVILGRAKERQSALYLSKPIEKEVLATKNISLGISGQKQSDNAGLAVQLATMWEKRHQGCLEPMECNVSDVSSVEGIPVMETTHLDDVIARGLSSCVWPGRAQTIKRPDVSVTYYLDGAHTKESIEVCSQWFKEKADEERSSIRGKVVRVLIFNVTGERKPGPLLECLKGCGFDAAGFCTNSVSTVESFNKKDQINPMYTSRVMIEKTEENKRCWDQLQQMGTLTNSTAVDAMSIVTGSLQHTPSAVSGKYSQQQHTTTTVDAPMINGPVSTLPTNTTNNNDNKTDMDNNDSNVVKACPCPSTTSKHSSAIRENDFHNIPDKIDVSIDPLTPHNAHCQYNNHDNYQHSNDNTRQHNNHTNRQHNNDKNHQHNNNDDNCQTSPHGRSQGKQEDGTSSSSSSSSSSCSQSFPCVLQGLVWATQGKDHSLFIGDRTPTIPSIPPALVGADHVQVLVTGSLLLVGGVLGVVDPNMNQ